MRHENCTYSLLAHLCTLALTGKASHGGRYLQKTAPAAYLPFKKPLCRRSKTLEQGLPKKLDDRLAFANLALFRANHEWAFAFSGWLTTMASPLQHHRLMKTRESERAHWGLLQYA